MAKMTRFLAICLALAFALMLSSPPTSVADGPRDYSVKSGPTDGGDGHPWDDGTTESTPGDDDGTTQPQQDILPSDPDLQVALTVQKGFITWTQRSLVSFWFKVRQFAQNQKSATKPAMEYKTKRSKSMQH